MVYIPEDIHEGLRRLSFEKRLSVAELIRKAVIECYLEDIYDMEKEIEKYKTSPEKAIDLSNFRQSCKKNKANPIRSSEKVKNRAEKGRYR